MKILVTTAVGFLKDLKPLDEEDPTDNFRRAIRIFIERLKKDTPRLSALRMAERLLMQMERLPQPKKDPGAYCLSVNRLSVDLALYRPKPGTFESLRPKKPDLSKAVDSLYGSSIRSLNDLLEIDKKTINLLPVMTYTFEDFIDLMAVIRDVYTEDFKSASRRLDKLRPKAEELVSDTAYNLIKRKAK